MPLLGRLDACSLHLRPDIRINSQRVNPKSSLCRSARTATANKALRLRTFADEEKPIVEFPLPKTVVKRFIRV